MASPADGPSLSVEATSDHVWMDNLALEDGVLDDTLWSIYIYICISCVCM